MTDYRQDSYQRYVSSFKKFEANCHTTRSEGVWPVFDRKYFKHLKCLRNSDPILEVGCGPGDFLAYLTQKGFTEVQGIDVSAEQIELARNRAVRAQCGDAFAFLEQQAEAFQAIVAIDFVEHFTKEECLRMFRAFHRALRPGGLLLIATPNGQGLFASQVIYGDLTHSAIFTPASLAQALRLCGFGGMVFDETGPLPKNLKGCLRLLLWRLVKLGANFIRLVEAGKSQAIWTENFICASRKA